MPGVVGRSRQWDDCALLQHEKRQAKKHKAEHQECAAKKAKKPKLDPATVKMLERLKALEAKNKALKAKCAAKPSPVASMAPTSAPSRAQRGGKVLLSSELKGIFVDAIQDVVFSKLPLLSRKIDREKIAQAVAVATGLDNHALVNLNQKANLANLVAPHA